LDKIITQTERSAASLQRRVFSGVTFSIYRQIVVNKTNLAFFKRWQAGSTALHAFKEKSMFWKTPVLTVLALILCLSTSISAKEISFEISSVSNFNFFTIIDGDEREIFELVNDERRKKRLNELNWNGDLAKIARAYSRKMAKESFFSHYDKDGKSVVERANDAKVRGWRQIGENLFFCQCPNDYSDFVVKGWMKSASHRRNILNGKFTSGGIGIAESRDGEIYVTQVFVQD